MCVCVCVCVERDRGGGGGGGGKVPILPPFTSPYPPSFTSIDPRYADSPLGGRDQEERREENT